MINIFKHVVISFGLFMFLYVNIASAAPLMDGSGTEQNISLEDSNFEHIKFKRIKASNYSFQNQQLKIEVDNSSSFLIKPFAEVRKISQVNLQWRSIGKLGIKNAEHEKKRDGDDAIFKIALLLKTDDTLFKPFMPAWMKRVDELLTLPTEKMIYLVAGSKYTAGSEWVNPYNDRVKMISMKSTVAENGWMKASYTLKQPEQVVGIWLMADGDNTHSQFTTKVKNIVLK